MGIGRRIKEAREKLGLTQSELAEKIGVTGSAITNYEKETSHPKEPIMYKLLEVLHVDANYLFQDVVSVKYEFKADYKEQKIIEKYRNLDDHGKKTVDFILDRETERTETIHSLTSKPEPITYDEMDDIWDCTPRDPTELERMCPSSKLDDTKKKIG